MVVMRYSLVFYRLVFGVDDVVILMSIMFVKVIRLFVVSWVGNFLLSSRLVSIVMRIGLMLMSIVVVLVFMCCFVVLSVMLYSLNYSILYMSRCIYWLWLGCGSVVMCWWRSSRLLSTMFVIVYWFSVRVLGDMVVLMCWIVMNVDV